MEQRVVESRLAYPSTSLNLSSKVEREMSDGTWMAKQQLMKPVQVAQVVWSTSNARDTEIYETSFPSVLQSVESLVIRTLRMYAFYKMSPVFRVQINATQFHQGQLICSFDPFSLSTRDSTVAQYSHIYATGLPNVKIMASESDAVELKIPFVHPRSFLTTNVNGIYNTMGTFRITVLNPLNAAEGASTNLTVTVWVYASDAEVHVPIQDHEPFLEPTSMVEGIQTALVDTVKNVKRGAGQIQNIYGNIVSGNFGQALRNGQGLVDTLGDIFGFDYPCRTLQPPKTISPVENLAIGKGQSQSQRMAIDAFSMHMLEDDIASESIQAMDISQLCKMPMLISQFSFLSTSPADSQLFTCPVSPITSASYKNLFRRTFLSFISNAFVYWSGGIDFDIEVVATRFHSGKLLFAYVPNDVTIPSYVSSATSLPNVIIDLQQTSKATFKIPYTASTAMKNVLNTLLTSPEDYCDSTIGTLVCFVQNTLAFASNVAPSVEINIYISAGDDFKLYVPSHPLYNYVPVPPPAALFRAKKNTILSVNATTSLPLNTTIQSSIQLPPRNALVGPSIIPTSGIGIDVNKDQQNSTTVVLSKDDNVSIARKHFGEDYSLIDIIRRFSLVSYDTLEADSPGVYSSVIPVSPYLDGFSGSTAQYDTYLGYFSMIYNAWSGSIRYKIIANSTRDQNITMQLYHAPTADLTSTINSLPTLNTAGLANLRTNACQDVAIECEVPYYSKFNMILTVPSSQVDYTTNGYLGLVINSKDATPPESVSVDVYAAAGEDFRFIYPRPPPVDNSTSFYSVQTLN